MHGCADGQGRGASRMTDVSGRRRIVNDEHGPGSAGSPGSAGIRRDHRDSAPSAQRQPECQNIMFIGQAAAAASRRNQRRGEVTRGGVRGGGAVCSPSVPCPRRRPWPRPAWPRPAAAARSTHSRGRRLLPAIAVRTLACADRTRERQEPRARNPSFKFYQGRARFERAVASPSWVSAEHRAAIARAPRHVCSRAAVSGFFLVLAARALLSPPLTTCGASARFALPGQSSKHASIDHHALLLSPSRRSCGDGEG